MEIRIAPGASLQEAVDRAAEGDTLLLEKGTHRILSPVLLRDKTGLTIRGEEGAVLTGSMALPAEWKPAGGGVFSLPLPKGLPIEALTVDGEEWIMARYPNFRPGERLGGWAARFVFRPAGQGGIILRRG